MQYGASKSGAELLKIITKGRTTRLSADALLEYFRPLETWLEQQNRNEPVIGWNSNLDDVAMFKFMRANGGSRAAATAVQIMIIITGCSSFVWLNVNIL